MMKSTEVDVGLFTTTATVLFQKKPTCFKIIQQNEKSIIFWEGFTYFKYI